MLTILLIPFLGAFMGYYLGKKNEQYRNVFNILMTAMELLLIIMLYQSIKDGPVEYVMPNIMGTGLHLKVDIMRYAMLFISGLAWFLATMYSTQYLIKKKNRNRYYFFFMLTYATTLGVFMSENLLNMFTFFEGMSLTSYALVIHDEDRYSHEAGKSYLAMAIAGGMVMLFGILMEFDYTGTLDIGDMGAILPTLGSVKYTIALLIMFGFMIKASVFPLHTWLPKAYPAAPSPASAILSGILLKTGLFGIIIILVELMDSDIYLSMLIYTLGLINIFLGGILAMLQRNIKRIIAYSSMSQTGFMLMGIGLVGILGESGGVALVGTILFMINHAFFKILLFFGAGIIYMILGELSINKIGGFGRNKLKLKLFFLIGVLGVAGMPGLSGFVSKTLVHEAILEAYHHTHFIFFKISEWLFLIGGGLTVAYMLKLFIAVFVEKNPEFHGQYAEQVHKRALLPMGVLAALILFLGIMPDTIIAPLSLYAHEIGMEVPAHLSLFNATTIGYAVISFVVGGVLYGFVIRRKLYVMDANEGHRIFVNPSLSWLSIESDVFAPIMRISYILFSVIFKIIDNGLLWMAQKTADFFGGIASIDAEAALNGTYRQIVTHTEHVLEDVHQKRQEKTELLVEAVSEKREQVQAYTSISPEVEAIARLKLKFGQIQRTASGITSAIFVFAFVVVFSMIFIYYFGHQ
jgi:formate hydrogenlyase subunit 3/multisubunit Na+/H+ antiporter MnhD subunit